MARTFLPSRIRRGSRTLNAALLLGLLFLTTAPLTAQRVRPEGRGAFQVGFQGTDLGDLNADLTGAGFPSFDDGLITLGGFGLGSAGRFLIGGEGHALLPTEETTADGTFRTRFGGGYGMFNLGYLAYSDDHVDIYPILGVGGGGTTLEIIERSSPTFDDVLDDPARGSRLTTGGFMMSVSVGADYRFGPAERERRRWRDRGRDRNDDDDEDDDHGGLFVGLRAGWLWTPGDARWELDELNEVAGGPNVGPTGLFIRLSVGGWGGS